MRKSLLRKVFFGVILVYLTVSCGGGGGGGGLLIPAAPGAVQIVVGDGFITISWGTVNGATSYTLYMASAPGVTKANYSSKPDGMKHANATSSYTHTGLTNGMPYYFVVTASNSAGESPESQEVSGTPTAPTGTPIGPAGGTVTTPDGNVNLIVPPGALSTTVSITVSPAAQYPAGGVFGAVYEFGPNATQFSQPSSLTLHYNPANLPPGADETALRLAKDVSGVWQELPGSVVDTNAKTVTGPLDSFSRFGIISPAGTTVYVVDSVPPGSTDHFRELPPAVAALCASLPAGQQGTVLIQTNRTLVVNTISFSCDIQIQVDSGYSGSIAGPGTTPLVVDAAGALNLSGLTISNAAGVVFNANRRMALGASNLPDGATINIGGISGASFPAAIPMGPAPAADDPLAKGTKVFNNVFGKKLTLNFSADVNTDADYEISDNQGSEVDVSGSGSLGASAKMNLIRNAFNFIDVDLKAKATSEINVKQNANLTDLGLNLRVGDTPTVNLDNNVSANVTVKADEFAQATFNLSLTSNNFQDAKLNFNVSDLKIKDLNNEWVQTAIILTAAALTAPVLMNYEAITSRYKGDFSFTAYDANFLDNKFKTNLKFDHVDLLGNFNATVNGEGNFDWNGATIKGFAKINLKGNASDWIHLNDMDVKWEAGLEIDAREAAGTSLSVKVTSQGGKFFKPATLWVKPDVAVTLTITDKLFDALGAVRVIGSTGGGSSPQGSMSTVQTFQPAQAANEIIIRNAQWQSAAASRLEGAIMVYDVKVSVTIENSTILCECLAIDLYNVDGPITLRNNTIEKGGIAVFNVSGAVTLEGNTVNHTKTFGGAITLVSIPSAALNSNTITVDAAGYTSIWGVNANDVHATLTNNIITVSSSNFAPALESGNNGVISAYSNQITGNVVAGGGGLFRLSGNTFSDTTIWDRNESGALINDPWTDNSGLEPGLIISPVDFDGDGCADYPYKPYDQRDPNTGNCYRDGVPPPPG